MKCILYVTKMLKRFEQVYLHFCSCLKKNPLCLLSLTWVYADFKKRLKKSPCYKRRIIKKLNLIYLLVAIVSILLYQILFFFGNYSIKYLPFIFKVIWGCYLLSRINEISYAFLVDAIDKLKKKDTSKLKGYERIKLVIRSYIELIINFALLYGMFPIEFWKKDSFPSNIIDNLYFSSITITTTGYGDISPANAWLKLLCMYEVFSGIIMLVICFSIYGSYKGKNNHGNNI